MLVSVWPGVGDQEVGEGEVVPGDKGLNGGSRGRREDGLGGSDKSKFYMIRSSLL